MIRLLPFVLLLACASEPVHGGDFGSQSAALESARLVHSQRVWAAPTSSDGPPRYTLAWEHVDGARTPAGVGLVTHARAWQGGALYVDPASTLRYEGRIVAHDVVDAPAVSDDGRRFAYVVVEEDAHGTRAVVHVSDGEIDQVWDRSLLTLGALRFVPDGSALVGIGSANGGVAGLHAISVEGARCLTNCGLRVGHAWDGYLAPPGSASALRFEGDRVMYDAPQGSVAEVWR